MLGHEGPPCPRGAEVDRGSAGANADKCPGMAPTWQVGSEDKGGGERVCWEDKVQEAS